MKKKKILGTLSLLPLLMSAQNVMTPEILWSLRKLNVEVVKPDVSAMIYKVNQVDIKTEKTTNHTYFLNLKNQEAKELQFGEKNVFQWDNRGMYAVEDGKIYFSNNEGKTWNLFFELDKEAENILISPDGKKIAFSRPVLVTKNLGKDKYQDTPNTTAHIYEDLNHRHWDRYNDGRYNHLFIIDLEKGKEAVDLLEGKEWDSPQKPFGGKEDFVFSPDSNYLLYVTKSLSGKEYAFSTNTDLFSYDIRGQQTQNLTEGNLGYDTNPIFSEDGRFLIWKSMEKDGYEADKIDLKILDWKTKQQINLTKNWDESVTGNFILSHDAKKIYFSADYRGVEQLFELDVKSSSVKKLVKQDTFDIGQIFGEYQNTLLVGKTDINHNMDLFSVALKDGKMNQITDINHDYYSKLTPSKSELRMVKTTDGKEMGVWFHYPPNFDPNKKYPTLLYCQGGPQSGLTPFFSTRWNFALMAANGYIVVAPNRRGMPGWGVKWNEEISKDWGGQSMRDYLAATDYAKKLPFVDSERVGAVGASYGGYSVMMLAGIHQNRFKTFIAHDGLFDMKMWYLTTEELWFANWDLGGSPYDSPVPKSYTDFNPSNFVNQWNRPIMVIQGGIDYRVPYEQGQGAFQAAKLKGLKTKFLYFPNENHWVLHPHNGIVWQREFFQWLKETL